MADPNNTGLFSKEEFLRTLVEPDKQCPICYDDYHLSDRFPIRLPCSHYACIHCIRRWTDAEARSTCPTCRHELYRHHETPIEPRPRVEFLVNGIAFLGSWESLCSEDINGLVRLTQAIWKAMYLIHWPEQSPQNFYENITAELIAIALERAIEDTDLSVMWPRIPILLRALHQALPLSLLPLVRLAIKMLLFVGWDHGLHISDDVARLWWTVNAQIPANGDIDWHLIHHSLAFSNDRDLTVMHWFTVLLTQDIQLQPHRWSSDLPLRNCDRVLAWGSGWLGFHAEPPLVLVGHVARVATRLKKKYEERDSSFVLTGAEGELQCIRELWDRPSHWRARAPRQQLGPAHDR
ncbi:hypothetical protein BU26DRAFT_343853 [Trematosphaeria pertusa]|uniref:RING-type domain-containing protein n=1 Tax=Trematosphaeria pertusa TaxID=390896 RepID=A0A6A6IBB8_9PLEO|nr:uncharacterized protein BU26DRAFT_343853 [Trematosphaeria pertusa]KAF2247212.1 hypothetical protein BU26DRAFT_343853 [Trematosphaeria pertusa]